MEHIRVLFQRHTYVLVRLIARGNGVRQSVGGFRASRLLAELFRLCSVLAAR